MLNIFLLMMPALIAWMDFRWRAIWWGMIPAMIAVLMIKSANSLSGYDAMRYSFINLCFLILQYYLAKISISIQNKKLTRLMNTYIGIGDVLFFISLCVAFSPVNFFMFYGLALFITLVVSAVYRLVVKTPRRGVPLAGGIALIFMAIQLTANFLPLDFYNDHFFIRLLYACNGTVPY